MLKEILVLLSVCLTVAIARTQCRHDSECGVGECCYYHEGPIIYSKKREVQGGWCVKYGQDGEGCKAYGQINGNAPGSSCTLMKYTTIAVLIPPTISTMHKRSIPRGYYLVCT